MREPAFWWRSAGLTAGLLAPLGFGYGAIVAKRMAIKGAPAGVPVLCVGNFTLGGAGKTPTVMMLARMFADAGERPFCLTRGYGGVIAGPKLVDAHKDVAAQVGAGAAFARTHGASFIILDDGLQNSSLMKDFTLAVVDARRGVGNKCVFPAGPLRAPLAVQFAQTDAVLVVGEGTGADDVVAQARTRGLPVFRGRLTPDPGGLAALKGRSVLAFAGIGDPEKFFASAVEAGFAVAERRAFADHHRYTAEEAAELIMQAEHSGLVLLTTEKDHARMAGEQLLGALATRAHTLRVTMMVEEGDELRQLLTSKLKR
jgi:tetraacyldisaccharide 4'-kinase